MTTLHAHAQPTTNEAILKQLKWRAAVKKFDTARKVSPENWATLEHALILSPSSFGIQPWKFIIVTDPAVREKLRPAAHDQAQIVDASHLVVLTFRKNLDEAYVQMYIDRIAEVRKFPAAKLEPFKQMMVGFVKSQSEEFRNAWSARQVYIALGTLLATAAMVGIDACPMEGFDPAKFNEILGLNEQGYSAVALCAIGYRHGDDPYASMAKVRFPAAQVVEHI
jgi:nitroreductase